MNYSKCKLMWRTVAALALVVFAVQPAHSQQLHHGSQVSGRGAMAPSSNYERRRFVNKRFGSFGLTEEEADEYGDFQSDHHHDSEETRRDGARYDQHGNRIRTPNGSGLNRRHKVQTQEAPRQRYQYREPGFTGRLSNSRTDDELEAVLEDADLKDFRLNRPEPAQKKVDVLQERQAAYVPASGPAYFTGPDLEGAVQSRADAYSSSPSEVYQKEDRLSFQIHGQKGPHSYRYGYDTGSGYNRQFRYEERDENGYVKGRYGFFDKYGKLQVVNYTADPHKGFHAEGAGVPY